MNATVNVVCFKSKTLSNGEHPLMIRVCKDGKKKYQSIGLSVKAEHWDFKKDKPKSNCPERQRLLEVIALKEAELRKQILEFNSIEKEYTATTLLHPTKTKIKLKTVGSFYLEQIKYFESTNHLGNKQVFTDSYRSLRSFTHNNLDILFSDIDVDWLNHYEQWLRGKGNKDTTIGILFRTLRSAYNKAIESKSAQKQFYPFNEFKVSKFNTVTAKRAIVKQDIYKLNNVDLSHEGYYTQFSRDIFMFSYLCAGINFTDIAYLESNNILDDKLTYIRRKTKKRITVPLTQEAFAIVQKYSHNKPDSKYVFPILDSHVHISVIQQRNRIHKVLGHVNKALKLIADKAGIKANLTTYVCRHSFATVLKRSGIATSIISESLGHSSEKITQIYLDSFENSQMTEAMKHLL